MVSQMMQTRLHRNTGAKNRAVLSINWQQ